MTISAEPKDPNARSLKAATGGANGFRAEPLATQYQEVMGRFESYKPTTGALMRVDTVRAGAAQLAEYIVDLSPTGREQSLALTALEEAVFWANKAITRYNQVEEEK